MFCGMVENETPIWKDEKTKRKMEQPKKCNNQKKEKYTYEWAVIISTWMLCEREWEREEIDE